MGTRIRIDSVMRPRSSSRGRNTSASVTVTVTVLSVQSIAVVLEVPIPSCHFTGMEMEQSTASIWTLLSTSGSFSWEGKGRYGSFR